MNARTIVRRARQLLGAALAALSLVYFIWFYDDAHRNAAMGVFVTPPLLLLLALFVTGGARAAFWAGVMGLVWFSHAVMLAWAQPEVRWLAWTAIVLSVVIVVASSLPGLHARFSRKKY